MRKSWKWAAGGLLGLLLFLQFFQPDKTPPPSDENLDMLSRLPADAKVAGLLERACQDCHSHKTKYPWYSYLAPVSFWIANHIEDGRKHFNMSVFGTYPPKKAAHKLEEGYEVLESHEMPMDSYTWLHPEARLTEEERRVLSLWFRKQYAAAEAGE